MMVLNLGPKVQMVFEEFRLPEVPGGNETLATRLEMGFDLFQKEYLFASGSEVVYNGDTENVVELRKILPAIGLGNISLDEARFGVIFDSFFEESGGEI